MVVTAATAATAGPAGRSGASVTASTASDGGHGRHSWPGPLARRLIEGRPATRSRQPRCRSRPAQGSRPLIRRACAATPARRLFCHFQVKASGRRLATFSLRPTLSSVRPAAILRVAAHPELRARPTQRTSDTKRPGSGAGAPRSWGVRGAAGPQTPVTCPASPVGRLSLISAPARVVSTLFSLAPSESVPHGPQAVSRALVPRHALSVPRPHRRLVSRHPSQYPVAHRPSVVPHARMTSRDLPSPNRDAAAPGPRDQRP
jgi:hypothetical protein